MILTTEAIVLHSRRFGDSSRIVVLYARDIGKVSVVAKGVRTQRSALASALEPLSHSHVTIYHKKNRDLHTVSSAEIASTRHFLLNSYLHIGTGLSMCEFVMRTQRDEEANPHVFELLRNSLEFIDACPESDCYRTSLAMRLALANIMGFGIADGELPEGVNLNLSDMALNTLHLALTHPNSAIGSGDIVGDDEPSTIDSSVILELEGFLQAYFSYHLDRNITSRSANFLLM
ncbi:MAG: DNA repair protein RecO [Ignavibacteria bacterium]|nr:DNA repair protein RecO [Ignavibacteria bacterium]